jgi:nucleoside phosphorylase
MQHPQPRTEGQQQRLPQRWLIVSAWEPELTFLRNALADLPASLRRRVTLASVGVGLVESAIGTTLLLTQQRPDAALLVGTAGLYPGPATNVELGQAAIAAKIVLLPEVLPGKHVFLPSILPDRVRCAPALVRILRRNAHLPATDVACPLGITATKKAAAAAAKLSGCRLENLEAFAVARAAATARVPFAAVLGIANQVGPAGHEQWKKHAQAAADAACKAVLAVLR